MFRGIVATIGLANFGFGILCLAQPQLVAAWIGFGLAGPSAYGEMRAVLGGLVAVVGVLFIVSTTMAQPKAVLGVLALVFAGLSVGRLVSLAVDGWTLYTTAALLIEAGTAAVSGLLWRRPELLVGGPSPPIAGGERSADRASTPIAGG